MTAIAAILYLAWSWLFVVAVSHACGGRARWTQ